MADPSKISQKSLLLPNPVVAFRQTFL